MATKSQVIEGQVRNQAELLAQASERRRAQPHHHRRPAHPGRAAHHRRRRTAAGTQAARRDRRADARADRRRRAQQRRAQAIRTALAHSSAIVTTTETAATRVREATRRRHGAEHFGDGVAGHRAGYGAAAKLTASALELQRATSEIVQQGEHASARLNRQVARSTASPPSRVRTRVRDLARDPRRSSAPGAPRARTRSAGKRRAAADDGDYGDDQGRRARVERDRGGLAWTASTNAPTPPAPWRAARATSSASSPTKPRAPAPPAGVPHLADRLTATSALT
jgi:hypothetical protein